MSNDVSLDITPEQMVLVTKLVETARQQGITLGMARMADILLSPNVKTFNIIRGTAALTRQIREWLPRLFNVPGDIGAAARMLDQLLDHLGAMAPGESG